MSPDEIITRILSAGGLLAGVAAMIGAWRSQRAGIKADQRDARKVEAEQRRDTIADRDALIDTLTEDVRELRARVDRMETELREEREYSRLLQDFIYRDGRVPPPRASPRG